jgi:hypothetical protein
MQTVTPGTSILLDDGAIELIVENIEMSHLEVHCKVMNTGIDIRCIYIVGITVIIAISIISIISTIICIITIIITVIVIITTTIIIIIIIIIIITIIKHFMTIINRCTR